MPDAEEKDKAQFRQYIDNRIDEIVAKHLEQLGRELDARIDGVGDLLFQRLAAVELRTLDLKSSTGPRNEPDNSAIEAIREHLGLDADADVLGEVRRIQSGWFDSATKLSEAHSQIRKLSLQVKEEAGDPSAVLAGVGRLIDEVLERRVENERLQKELDELLGSEFFRTGERLRRGAAKVLEEDLRRILLDELARFWLSLILREAEKHLEGSAVLDAVNGLMKWRKQIDDWCATHLSPTSTED